MIKMNDLVKYDKNKAHYVATVVIIKDNKKYLIVKRSKKEVAFPNLWGVIGGAVEIGDYMNRQKDTTESWFNVLEKTLKREVMEEVGLHVKNIDYLTSMAFQRPDGVHALGLIFSSDLDKRYYHDVILNDEHTEFAWVTIEEAQNFDLIDGVFDELYMVDKGLERWKKIVK